MSNLSVGIVGLPNVGKSTLFNTLLKKQVASVAAYPFTTIDANVGMVEVPDERLQKLAEIVKPDPSTSLRTAEPKVTPAVVQFIDIAGLVKNAHQGEGLGNQFLAKIRECDVIIHLLREFEDESVAHYYETIDPQRDKEIVDIELELGEIKKPVLYVVNTSSVHDSKLEIRNAIPVNAKTGEGVDRLIQEAYKLLGLITFYTIKGGKELRAWSLKKGLTALGAAEKVHTDMAKGFIKAEVVGFDDLVAAGGWPQARAKGKIRLEGRDYQVQDGDVVEFKFSHH